MVLLALADIRRQLGRDIRNLFLAGDYNPIRSGRNRVGAEHVRHRRRRAYEPESGYADPVATTYAYAGRAREHGAELLTRTPATGLAASGGRVTGVETACGLIETPAAIVATGPWCNQLAASVEESLPVTPVRVQMASFRCPPALESMTTTVIAHATGAYFRADSGNGTLVGGEAAKDLTEVVDPNTFGLNADHDSITSLWDRARLRFPDFASAICRGGYGSLYDMTPDGNPILDRSGTVEGLYWAVGFSGYGFKLSPVVGRMVSELVMYGESKGHPIRAFRASRFGEDGLLAAQHPYRGAGHP